MIKNIISAVAFLALTTTTALAGSVTGEVKIADPKNGHADYNEYGMQYNDSYDGILKYGAELTVKQGEHQGALGSKFSGKIGPALPEFYGFKPAVYGELGRSLAEHNDYNFFGIGGTLSHKVYGPVNANIGYRYRKGFDTDDLRENRYNAGLSVDVTKTFSIGTNYYWYSGKTNSDAIGVALKKTF